MEKYARDEESGQLYVVTPFGKSVPIEPRDIVGIEAGGLSQFLSAADRGVEGLAEGAGMLFGGDRARHDELQRQGAVMGEVNPLANAGEMLPELAGAVGAGLATGGASIPMQMGVAAAVEGGLGFLDNPDSRIQSGLIQGGLGAIGVPAGAAIFSGAAKVGSAGGRAARSISNGATRAVEATRAATGRTVARTAAVDVAQQADGSMGAARVPAGEDLQMPRNLEGYRTADEVAERMEGLGVEGDALTVGQRMALEATTPEEVAAATTRRGREELARSSPIQDKAMAAGGKTATQIIGEQEDAMTAIVNEALGQRGDTALTDAAMRRITSENSADFEAVAAHAGPLKFDGQDMGKIGDALTDVGANDATAVGKVVKDLEADIEAAGGTGAHGQLTPKKAQDWRSTLGKKQQQALNAEQFAKAQAYQEIQDVLDDIVERQIPDEVAETLFEARRQHQIIRALKKPSSRDADGELNARSFQRSISRNSNTFGESFTRGTRTERRVNADRARQGLDPLPTVGGKFMQELETFGNLVNQQRPNSNTVDRLLAAAGPKTQIAGAALQGARGLLGEPK